MKLKLTASTFILGLLLTAIGLLFIVITGCTSTKKSTTEKSTVTEQGSSTKIEYRTNTIYTDTGSITTYYRDSVIFSHDTIFQPIEKIVNRWFKQEAKHNSFTKIVHDTLYLKAKEKLTQKEKKGVDWGFLWWLIPIILLLFFRASILNLFANFKL